MLSASYHGDLKLAMLKPDAFGAFDLSFRHEKDIFVGHLPDSRIVDVAASNRGHLCTPQLKRKDEIVK